MATEQTMPDRAIHAIIVRPHLRTDRFISMISSRHSETLIDTHAGRPHSALLDRTFSVAPMMDWTTRDYRAFARTLTRHALLYTEMVTTGAVLHGSPRERFLGHDATEHPLALQLGGSDPGELAECAAIAEAWGYDEVNLNVRSEKAM